MYLLHTASIELSLVSRTFSHRHLHVMVGRVLLRSSESSILFHMRLQDEVDIQFVVMFNSCLLGDNSKNQFAIVTNCRVYAVMRYDYDTVRSTKSHFASARKRIF